MEEEVEQSCDSYSWCEICEGIAINAQGQALYIAGGMYCDC